MYVFASPCQRTWRCLVIEVGSEDATDSLLEKLLRAAEELVIVEFVE